MKSADGAGVPVIVVNANDPGERQRFTVAHELGHLYLDIPKQIEPEPLCHRFAGAFLVPGQMLQKEVGNYCHAISVRELFQLRPPEDAQYGMMNVHQRSSIAQSGRLIHGAASSPPGPANGDH